MDKHTIATIMVVVIIVAAIGITTWIRNWIVYPNATTPVKINLSCSMIQNATNPPFDYCSSSVDRITSTYYEYTCKCCWDRSDEYGFILCRFYGVKVQGNTTELWEYYPSP